MSGTSGRLLEVADRLAAEGDLLYDEGDLRTAVSRFEEAVAIRRMHGDRVGESECLLTLGSLCADLDLHERALGHYEEALGISRELDDRDGEKVALWNLGDTHIALGQSDQAVTHYEGARVLAREIGDRSGESGILNGLGAAYRQLGRLHEAVTQYDEALAVARGVGDLELEREALDGLGAVYDALAGGHEPREISHTGGSLVVDEHAASEIARLRAEGGGLYALGQLAPALPRFEQALEIAHTVGDRREETYIRNELGSLYHDLGRLEDARQQYESALSICIEIGARDGEAASLSNLGDVLRDLGRLDEALLHLETALTITQEINERIGESSTLGKLGAVHSRRGQPRKAIECFKRAISISSQIGDVAGRGQSLRALGAVCFGLGRFEKAIEPLAEGLDIARFLGDRISAAVCLANLGTVFEALGRGEEAFAHLEEALALHRDVGNRAGEAAALNGLAAVLLNRGEVDRALACVGDALTIIREVGDPAGEAAALRNIGWIDQGLDRYEQALARYEEAIAIHRRIGDRAGEASTLRYLATLLAQTDRPGEAAAFFSLARDAHRELEDARGEAMALEGLGSVQLTWAQTETAADYFEEALAVSRNVGDRAREAALLILLGRVQQGEGRSTEAFGRFEKAKEILREIGAPIDEYAAWVNLGALHLELGRLDDAAAEFEGAIKIVESIRDKIAADEVKTGYFRVSGEVYRALIALSIQREDPIRAFSVTEQAKARSLLDLLTESHVREGVDPALGQQEQRLLAELSVLRTRLLEERTRPEPDPDEIEQLDRETRELELEYSRNQTEIGRRNPRYAALTQPQIWDLDRIRLELLDEDTILLEYVLAEPASFLFVVSKDEFEVFILAPREELETKVRELRAAVVSGLHRYPHGYELYESLLAPAKELIAGKDLLICADGALHYLPFALLLTEPVEGGDEHRGRAEPPQTRMRTVGVDEEERELIAQVEADMATLPAFDYRALPFLIREHALAYAPSATVAGMVREEARAKRTYQGLLAAFADPQGLTARAGEGELPVELEAALVHTHDALDPIPETATEVWALAGLLAEDGLPDGRPDRFDDAQLTLRTAAAATKEELERLTRERSFRFLHIATHGLLDAEKPQFSGLVFTPGTEADPFWRTFEIFNARLPCELVCLSACETGLGKIVSGEGIVGLTRAFLYAGASAVCVSLWKVAEESSPALMGSFYRGVLGGESKARALQRAQLEMIEKGVHAHPFWWAPFVVVGEALRTREVHKWMKQSEAS